MANFTEDTILILSNRCRFSEEVRLKGKLIFPWNCNKSIVAPLFIANLIEVKDNLPKNLLAYCKELIVQEDFVGFDFTNIIFADEAVIELEAPMSAAATFKAIRQQSPEVLDWLHYEKTEGHLKDFYDFYNRDIRFKCMWIEENQFASILCTRKRT